MRKSPILSVLCALFLVSSLSGCFVKDAIQGSSETKGYVIKRVKTPDMTAPAASANDGSGWKLIDWGQELGYSKKGTKGISVPVIVYFFRDFENFTCRVYRAKNGKPGGDAASLPKKALGVGFHRFGVTSRKTGNIKLECRESDSLPLTLGEL